MTEFVFSFRDGSGKHLMRAEGADENAAFEEVKKTFPDAVKLAGFPVDDTLDKILGMVKFVNKDELDDLAAHADRQDKANAAEQYSANVEQLKRGKMADFIAQKTLQNGEMEQEDWNRICSTLKPEEKKALYDEFIADADKSHTDPKQAALEKMFINRIFGVKEKGKHAGDAMKLRDLAKLFGISHVMVLKIQRDGLKKLVNNIAKAKNYPFKITSAAEALSLLLADNIVNPEDLKFNVKIDKSMDFEEAMKAYSRMEKEAKIAGEAKRKKDAKLERKARAKAMEEFKKLEKEMNDLRKKLNLPRINEYAKYFLAKKEQMLGNWA